MRQSLSIAEIFQNPKDTQKIMTAKDSPWIELGRMPV
jgi:hypothetical protein